MENLCRKDYITKKQELNINELSPQVNDLEMRQQGTMKGSRRNRGYRTNKCNK